jgi:hypothetical protein
MPRYKPIKGFRGLEKPKIFTKTIEKANKVNKRVELILDKMTKEKKKRE